MKMKKIFTILMVYILFSVVPAVSSTQIHKIGDIQWTGEFEGVIGYKNPDTKDTVVVGNISGNYKLGKKGGYFEGEWKINKDNKTGTVKGIFGKHILLGKIMTKVGDEKKTLPIVGFIVFKDEYKFGGRYMSIAGPALYFWGEYAKY